MQRGILRRIMAVSVFLVGIALAEDVVDTYSQPIAIRQWISQSRYPIESLSGRPYIIVFWATWCPACVEAMPVMKELYEKYEPQGLRVLGLSIDQDYSKVVSFIKDKDIKFPVAIDAETDRKYESKFVPTAFLVDSAGYLVWKGHPTKYELEGPIEKVLKESPTPVLAGLDFTDFTDSEEPVEEGKSFMLVLRKLKAYASKENPLQEKAQGIIDTINTRLDQMLVFAGNLEKQEKFEPALNVYIAIIKNYGGTEASREAGQKIKQLKLKNSKSE